MSTILQLDITGLTCAGLNKADAAGNHPDTALLMLGGRHTPVLALDYFQVNAVNRTLDPPARPHAQPNGSLWLHVDLAGFEVVVDADHPAARGFKLGPLTPPSSLQRNPQTVEEWSDLGYVVDVEELSSARLSRPPLDYDVGKKEAVAARFVLDRGLLCAARPANAKQLATRWDFGDGKPDRPAADRMRLTYRTDRTAIKLQLRDPRSKAEAYRIVLVGEIEEPGGPAVVRASLFSLCGWIEVRPTGMEDVAAYAAILAGRPTIKVPKPSSGLVTSDPTGCPPGRAGYA